MRHLFAIAMAAAAGCATFSSSNESPATDAGDAGAGDAGAAGCNGGCPANAVCEEGECVLSGCTGGGDVVLLRPKGLLDVQGAWSTFPAGATILDVVRDRAGGDGDQSYAAATGASPSLRLGVDLFKLPQGRAIERVVVRARVRRVAAAAADDAGAVDAAAADADAPGTWPLIISFYLRSINRTHFYKLPAGSIGTGYTIAEYGLSKHPEPEKVLPYDPAADEWNEERVNDIDLELQVPFDPATSELRLTQAWIAVCLAPTN